VWSDSTGRHVPAPTTFATKAEASRWLAALEFEGRSISPQDRERAGQSLSDYASAWLQSRPLRPRTRELYESQLRRHILPTLGARPIGQVRPAEIRRWFEELSAGPLGQVTVAKVYRLLRTILGTAVDDGIIAANPCQIRKGGVERSPTRPIPSIADVQALAAELPAQLRPVPWIAALGGLRKGEILALARCHVDLRLGTIRVERALQEIRGEGVVFVPPKTSASVRTVVIPATLVQLLGEHLDTHVGAGELELLFTNVYGNPIRGSVWTPAWKAAQQAAGRDLRLHDLRHLGGTLTAQAGATLKETMERLGHSSPQAALRYQHVAANRAQLVATGIEALLPADR
jgi:integrase